MKLDENKLLERAKHGSERAFEELVRLYEARVFSYAMTLLGNRPDACAISRGLFLFKLGHADHQKYGDRCVARKA